MVIFGRGEKPSTLRPLCKSYKTLQYSCEKEISFIYQASRVCTSMQDHYSLQRPLDLRYRQGLLYAGQERATCNSLLLTL